ncbi:MAG: SAM-dependent methyltransferase [Planctomycetota bacterium]|nr:MAG: SAM-dependent methyltransferase [Planctomycetota bacterium]
MVLSKVSPDASDSSLPNGANGDAQFLFCICQQGTETVVKSAAMAPSLGFRLAFSRPGLLTFKLPPSAERSTPNVAAHRIPSSVRWAVRLAGYSLGQIQGTDAREMAGRVANLAGSGWDAVHVFPRDRALPGFRNFEPGPDVLSHAIADQLRPHFPGIPCGEGPASMGNRVLDIVLIEPHHWLVGWHTADRLEATWPGGVFPCRPPADMISRAYLKMAEAVAWSRLPMRPGDRIVEIGSAPGGAAQRLVETGLQVVGIDPAEMDPLILGHPGFEHWRGKSSAIKRRRYAQFRWLAADMNVAPNYTLDAVGDIVQYPTSQFQGLILTLKLSSYDLAQHFDAYRARVHEWGFRRVDIRQLAFNRREVCLVAER